MKSVHVIHNPHAGDRLYDKAALKRLLKRNGLVCRYFSTKKKGWKKFDENSGLLVIAGGDGTVRKVIARILKKEVLDKPVRIAILPLGTANNISKAFGIIGSHGSIVQSWLREKTVGFDIGRIPPMRNKRFFLESFGYGVFPALMKAMQQVNKSGSTTAEKRKEKTLELFRKIINSYKPKKCTISVDGVKHAGKFLLVEVLNIPYMGPNLCLSRQADSADGKLDVVMVGTEDKKKFIGSIAGNRAFKMREPSFRRLAGSKVWITWSGHTAHADDELVRLKKGQKISLRVEQGLINLVVP
jgi:diacylglycerol kinase (ATP)